jgi:hypothetical protein
MLLLLAACSDYALEPEKTEPAGDTAEPGAPAAAVAPAAIDLGIVCGALDPTSVTVTNTGTANLVVGGAEVTGAGWALGDIALPADVAAGGTLEIPLVPGFGTAVLEVYTDDPSNETLSVPLAAVADAPPAVAILSPADGAILDNTATILAGVVADDVEDPTALVVGWASDVDGALLSTVSPGGDTTVEWDPTVRTAGSHTVTLSATDACGQSALATMTVCQDQGYDAENLDLDTWHFEGTSRWDGSNNWVELTQPLDGQGGTAFQTSSTVGADNVSIDFAFYVSGGSGADGFSVTALDSARMTSFVGATGGGIGYMGLPGWSIEVDTYYNGEYDPTAEDHLSIHFDGDVANPVAWVALPEMEDGAWHEMEVNVLAPHVTVSIDGTVYLDTDLSGFTAFPAYVGFTAATGSLTNYHLIDALTVTRYVCQEE